MVYSGLQERLNTLLLRASMAFYLHASNPRVKGNDEEYLRQQVAAHEVRTALKESNPVFADQLLPVNASLAAVNGLPLLPAGVRYVVDEAAPDTVSIAVELAGVTFTVSPPNQGASFAPTVVSGATRTTSTFAARLDGLYGIVIKVGTTRLATVYVPVERALLRALRENNRQNAYAFLDRLPTPNPAYVSRYARWIAADALAATGQVAAYHDMIASAAAVTKASSPIAIYPRRHA